MTIKGIYNRFNAMGFFRFIPDSVFLKFTYRLKMGKELRLNPPITFNEKLQWLKLYDRRPKYTMMVDKYEVKKWVEEQIGQKYIIPTLGLWERFDDINFETLPNQFVLKCTHDSGGVIICRDKKGFDIEAARKILQKSMQSNFYYRMREWPYKDVKRRIIAEEYLPSLERAAELVEYKLFCFDGEPKLVLVCKGEAHGNGRTNDFYSLEFEHIPVRLTYPNAKEHSPKPDTFDEMVAIARKLSAGIPHLRVDLYDVNGRIYFGETTFFHDGGFCKFEPSGWDEKFGELLNLPVKKEKE